MERLRSGVISKIAKSIIKKEDYKTEYEYLSALYDLKNKIKQDYLNNNFNYGIRKETCKRRNPCNSV